MRDRIQTSYRSSRNIYDDIITHRTWWSKLYARVLWGGVNEKAIASFLIDQIPTDFDGRILDVPVGTAVFTAERYATLRGAEIIGLDYSEEMLALARTRCHKAESVQLLQGDVGALPFPNGHFDLVLSMNGFHVFPDKPRAYAEVSRVLKLDGRLLFCQYVEGNLPVADCLVRNVLCKKGWFTPPFDTEDSLAERLTASYRLETVRRDGAIVYGVARKRT